MMQEKKNTTPSHCMPAAETNSRIRVPLKCHLSCVVKVSADKTKTGTSMKLQKNTSPNFSTDLCSFCHSDLNFKPQTTA